MRQMEWRSTSGGSSVRNFVQKFLGWGRFSFYLISFFLLIWLFIPSALDMRRCKGPLLTEQNMDRNTYGITRQLPKNIIYYSKLLQNYLLSSSSSSHVKSSSSSSSSAPALDTDSFEASAFAEALFGPERSSFLASSCCFNCCSRLK